MSMSTETSFCSIDAKISRFLEWLIAHGARFPKINWPTTDTPSGIRGAIALEDIATNEFMLEIPENLMMSPPQILSHPSMGQAMNGCLDLLHGDLLLAVYIMHELRLGESSFYKPYIDILPEPDCLTEWRNCDLSMLQDERLILRSKQRRTQLKRMYDRCIVEINRRFPEHFPLEEFTFSNFKFAWNTIQARAFGRRLPWTALVPFADCLNHSNVQTKYDYLVNQNGKFRLFPTGENHYKKGEEVFNSYGRRHNENLLLDYGFAIMDNEWDEVEVPVAVNFDDDLFSLRSRILHLMGYSASTVFSISAKKLPLEAMLYVRILSLTKEEIEFLLDKYDQFVNAKSNYEEGLTTTRRDSQFFEHIMSLGNEVESIKRIIHILEIFLNSFPSVNEDTELLAHIGDNKNLEDLQQNYLGLSSDEMMELPSSTLENFKDRCFAALTYRITRKKIVLKTISNLKMLSTILTQSIHCQSDDHLVWIRSNFPMKSNSQQVLTRYMRLYEQYLEDLRYQNNWILES